MEDILEPSKIIGWQLCIMQPIKTFFDTYVKDPSKYPKNKFHETYNGSNTSIGKFITEIEIDKPSKARIKFNARINVVDNEKEYALLNGETEISGNKYTCKLDYKVYKIYGKDNAVPKITSNGVVIKN